MEVMEVHIEIMEEMLLVMVLAEVVVLVEEATLSFKVVKVVMVLLL